MKLTDLNLADQRVLVRVDFNVPLDKNLQVSDMTRIEKALPTLNYILEQGGRLILLSHLGRPQKKKLENGELDVKKFTLQNIIPSLSKALDKEVSFADNIFGTKATSQSLALKNGEILLIENTRFHEQESKGDLEFASRLAALGDVYVNDAFGTAHRAHASTTTVAKFFPAHRKAAGLLLEKEIESAKSLTDSPKRPFVAIVGGAKVSDKIQLLYRLIEKVNKIIIGGGMAYTFIKAAGGKIGNSLCEDDYLDLANEIVQKAKEANVDLYLPLDSRCSKEFKDIEPVIYSSNDIPDDMMGLDVGPKSEEQFSKVLEGSKSILWNGPLGVFEFSNYSKGTFSMADAIAKATSNGAFSLIGGGDSVSAVNKSGLSQKVSHISTGGGAMLELLEGKVLPGIQALDIS